MHFFHRIQDPAIAFYMFFICFYFFKKSSFRIFPWFFALSKSAPRQLAAFVLSPLPPAVLPAPLKAPSAPAMHSSPQDPSSIKSINRFNRYWQSIGDLPVVFSSTGLHVNTCTFMTFPNSAWKVLQQTLPWFKTSWRPGQLAGWFIITKERHHHMLITSKMKSAGKLIATAW